MKKTWLIYVDIMRFNLFGAVKEQIENAGDKEILWGLDDEHLETADKGQEVYFYITNVKKEGGTGNVEYHFLKRFAFKGVIAEITEQKPEDGKYWTTKEDADKDLKFEKYARIKIIEDLTDKNVKSNVIKWNIGKDSNRRMILLEDENIARLNEAIGEK